MVLVPEMVVVMTVSESVVGIVTVPEVVVVIAVLDCVVIIVTVMVA